MKRFALCLCLGFLAAAALGGAKAPPPDLLFTVQCRNGAVVPWVEGKATYARVCALEAVAELTGKTVAPVQCSKKARKRLTKNYFKKDITFDLIGPGGKIGAFRVLAVEDGWTNPACGLTAWGIDELDKDKRERSAYVAVPREANPAPINAVARRDVLSGAALTGCSPVQVQASVSLDLPGADVSVLEAQCGEPDAMGRFPTERLVIDEHGQGGARNIVTSVVHPSQDIKTTRMRFVDAFDAGADGTPEVLLLEQHRDGTGDWLLLQRNGEDWTVVLRTAEKTRRRYKTPPSGAAFNE